MSHTLVVVVVVGGGGSDGGGVTSVVVSCRCKLRCRYIRPSQFKDSGAFNFQQIILLGERRRLFLPNMYAASTREDDVEARRGEQNRVNRKQWNFVIYCAFCFHFSLSTADDLPFISMFSVTQSTNYYIVHSFSFQLNYHFMHRCVIAHGKICAMRLAICYLFFFYLNISGGWYHHPASQFMRAYELMSPLIKIKFHRAAS